MKAAYVSPPATGHGSGAGIRRMAFLVPIVLAVALGACAKQPKGQLTTGSIGTTDRPLTADELDKATTYWGERYAKNPKDTDAALNYATALRRNGRNAQSVAVLQKAVLAHPEDRAVLSAYGKALAASGQLDRALQIIRRTQKRDRPDWRLLSAEAAILDQKGLNANARKLYLQARDIAPNEPSILSNLGMSYLLTGDLPEAEKALRQAAALPGADSRIRQNLALAVGLQGRFSEAEKIASAELSPEQAAANVSYLKTMLAQQQGNWKKLKTADARPR